MIKLERPLVAAQILLAILSGCTLNDRSMTGVSEETNAIAGILSDGNGKPVSGTVVLARHTTIDSLTFTDTTKQDGSFSFRMKRKGAYGISAQKDSLAYFDVVEYYGQTVKVDASLRPTASITAKVALSDGLGSEGIEVGVPGYAFSTVFDSTGYFTLSGLPVGQYNLLVRSPDPGHYPDAVYTVNLQQDTLALGGPLPTDAVVEDAPVTSIDGDAVLTLPLSTEYKLLSWWPMDKTSVSDGDTIISDARGHMGDMKIYGSASLTDGAVGKAIRFNDAAQFGVIEDDSHALDGLTELTLEAFVKFNGLGKDERSAAGQKNIIGKLGFGSDDDQNVFSLALIDGVCGAEKPALAFFMAQEVGEEFSCDHAVISDSQLVENEWIHVVVTWKEGFARIYQNSELAGSGNVGVNALPSSNEPIFFGKENLDFELDDVRLGAIAITSADVLYRYYQKIGR